MFKALLGASRTTTMKRGALPGGNGRRRASSFALGVAAALLTLAACAAVDRPIAAATAGRTAVVVPIPPAVAVKLPPAVAMVPPPPIEPAAVATDAVIIPAAAAAATVDPGLARLQGLRRAELADLLGTPDFVRRDPPAELWQYRGVECVLDLFLYRKAAGDEYRVEHAESHDRFTSREAKSGCAAALVQQRKLSAPQTAAARL